MKLLALLVLTAATSFAEVSTQISIDKNSIPESVSGIPWSTVTNHATQGNPDQGVAVNYVGTDLKIDLYIYDSLKPEWSKLPLAQRIEKESAGIADTFKQFTDRGDYSNVTVKPSTIVTAGERQYTHTEIDFTDKQAGVLNSHYYLTEFNGRILKIRVSRKPATSLALVEAAFNELAETYSKKAGAPKRGGSPRARELK